MNIEDYKISDIQSDSEAIIDFETLNKLKDDVSQESLIVMLGIFRHELIERVDSIRIAITKSDINVVRSESHTLESIAGQFGALRLRSASAKVNYLCRQDDTSQAIKNAQDIIDLGIQTVENVNKLLESNYTS